MVASILGNLRRGRNLGRRHRPPRFIEFLGELRDQLTEMKRRLDEISDKT